jgi:hypothetical protein
MASAALSRRVRRVVAWDLRNAEAPRVRTQRQSKRGRVARRRLQRQALEARFSRGDAQPDQRPQSGIRRAFGVLWLRQLLCGLRHGSLLRLLHPGSFRHAIEVSSDVPRGRCQPAEHLRGSVLLGPIPKGGRPLLDAFAVLLEARALAGHRVRPWRLSGSGILSTRDLCSRVRHNAPQSTLQFRAATS